MSSATKQQPIRTLIPARLDRLRWTPFHTRMVAGLGAALTKPLTSVAD
jgi:hypothetical protein